MSYARFLRSFYLLQFFTDFILVYAVDKLLFLSKGLTLYQIAILVAFWSGSHILLEIPTGALADKWSRQKMLVFSGLFYSLCYLTWLFSSTFWLFLLGFFFRTIGGTFSSGTLEAYVYDFLKRNGKEDDFEKIWGRGFALSLIGTTIAISLGGALSSISYGLVLVFSALAPLIVSGIALSLPDTGTAKTTPGRSYLSFIKEGARQAFSSNVLIQVFLYSAIIHGSLGILDEYHQVLMSSWLDLSNSFIGIWLAVCFGMSGITAFSAHRFRHNSLSFLYLLGAISGILLLVIALFKSLLILGILVAIYIFMALMSVLMQGIIQREIASEERATITSVNHLSEEAGSITHGLLFGFVASHLGIQTGYGFYGLVIMVFLLGFVIARMIYRARVKR